jgi:hypothetical protein
VDYCNPLGREELVSVKDTELLGKIALPNQPEAKDTSFRKRGFYKMSVKKMKELKRKKSFTWFCLMSFKTSPLINHILFQVNGDLTKLDERFNGVVAAKIRVAKALKGERDPYSIFATFFKTALQQAVDIGQPLRDPWTRKPILKKRQLIAAFPWMRTPLTMKSKAAFVRCYIQALQGAIYSIEPLSNALQTWRGYSPLNIPGTMSMDPRYMKVGQELINWAFMSVSLDLRVSTLFMKRNISCCMVTVIIPPRFRAFLISGDSGDKNYPTDITPWHQMEVLLPIGCVFRVEQTFYEPVLFETTNPGERVYSYSATLRLIEIRPYKTKVDKEPCVKDTRKF